MVQILAISRLALIAYGASLVLVLGGCQSNVKPFEQIKSVESFCQHGAPKRSSILSIMSALSDTPKAAPERKRAEIYAHLRSAGGTVAHWSDLNILLPVTAKLYGDGEGYIHVLAAAIDNPGDDAQSRTVQLLVHQDHGDSWREFQSFDVVNVCVEGTPQS